MEFALKMDDNLIDFIRPVHQDGLMCHKQSPCQKFMMTLGTKINFFLKLFLLDKKKVFLVSNVGDMKEHLNSDIRTIL